MRNDVHSPKNMLPEQYDYVDCWYQGPHAYYCTAYAKFTKNLSAMVFNSSYQGNFAEKRTCDHCGAAFHHGVVYRHKPTGDVIVVGHECAYERFSASNAEYVFKHIQKYAKALKEAAKRKDGVQKFLEENPGLEEALGCGHHICEDMAKKLQKYGSLSPKQVAFAMKLAAEKATPKKKKEPEFWTEVQNGRRELTGEVLATKIQDSYYGMVRKMLFKVVNGPESWEKVWMTCPSGHNIQKGDKLAVRATVEQSKDDPLFGFGSRPTLVKVIQKAEEAAV